MASVLAIIPARGGSKRIPRKNIKCFCGKPIIEYSIGAAAMAECFDEIMVSTDDQEIAAVSLKAGASIPFFRSQEKSSDYAMLADVIEEVLLEYQKRCAYFDYFCCILATAPFVSADKIKAGFNLLKVTGADSVVAVTRFSYPIQRALKIERENLAMFWPENYNIRSQDLEPAYHDSGQFYWMRSQSLLEQRKLFAKHTVPLVISEFEAQDIDTEEDWMAAEIKFSCIKKL